LQPYRFSLEGITSDHDLMNASFASYGETNEGWTASDARGFIKITANQGKIFHHVNRNS
jgi:argininosuccinate synthase